MHILVADDQAQNRYLLQFTLQSEGHRVTCASNGEEALNLAHAEPPDLIISDILMPVMDGFALCLKWKADPQLHDRPFVFYTATYTGPKDRDFALSLGADRFLVKPQEAAAWPGILESIVRSHRPSAAPFPAPETEVAVLRSYNEVLVHKLEQKITELETAQAQLRSEIEERERAEQNLRETEARSRAVVENSPIGIYLTDPQGSLLYANPAVLRLLRISNADTLLGNLWLNYVHPEDRERAFRACQRHVAGFDFDLATEYRLCAVDGSERLVSVQAQPVREGERVLSFVGSVVDITERRQADEQRAALEADLRHSQKLEAVGTLAGGVAHDFNNILSAIIGNTELARQDVPANHPVQQCLGEIFKASVRARNLIRQILAFSRKQQPEKQTISLRAIAEESVALVRPSLPAGLKIDVTVAPDSPQIFADPTQIHQVLTNLLTNAWQAMDGKPGHISLQVKRIEVGRNHAHALPTNLAPGEYASISVSDTGKGISRDLMDRIFEPFFTTKPAGQGTGLGLSVVHGIVKSHSGTLAVASEPNQGSTFYIYFPAASGNAATERKPSGGTNAPFHSPLPHGNGQRILFLDDEEQLIFLATRFLERIGYRVSGFTDADAAVEAVRAAPGEFDLAVTDMSMPEKNGLQVARTLIEIRPDLPIILASGNVSQTLKAEATAVGIREVFYKPDSVEELCRTIHRLAHATAQRG